MIIKHVVNKIRTATGYFWEIRTIKFLPNSVNYQLICPQDTEKKRTKHRKKFYSFSLMTRCSSRCSFNLDLVTKRLDITYSHLPHDPPRNLYKHVSLEEIAFIDGYLVENKTASISDVYQALTTHNKESQNHQGVNINQNAGSNQARLEVYRHVVAIFKDCTMKYWKRDDDDDILSTFKIADAEKSTVPLVFGPDKKIAAGFIIKDMVDILPKIEYLAMDFISDLANKGLKLFTILGVINGMGFPLMYWWCQKNDARVNISALLGLRFLLKERYDEKLLILSNRNDHHLEAIKCVSPHFEIKITRSSMSKTVYNDVIHMPFKPAALYKKLLNEGNKPKFLEGETFGLDSNPKRTINKEIAEEVKQLMIDIASEHQLLPGSVVSSLSSELSYEILVTKVLKFCKERKLEMIWQYLYFFWLQPKYYKMWCISSDPSNYDLQKTTMLIDDHWTCLRTLHLRRIILPRCDFSSFVIIRSAIPDFVKRKEIILKGGLKFIGGAKFIHELQHYGAHWRFELLTEFFSFNRKWKSLEIDTVKYQTNLFEWTCKCSNQKNNRFLLCEHLWKLSNISIYNDLEFFLRVEYNSQPPFLRHHLVQNQC